MDRLVITGAANGIGREMARLAQSKGFNPLLVDLDEQRLTQTAKEHSCESIAGNVSDPSFPTKIATWLEERGDGCSGLINNAANIKRSRLEEVTPESFHAMMATNVLGPMLLIQGLLPSIEKTKGKIVNIGSTNAYGGEPILLEYSIGKAGLACMTKNLAPTLAAKGVSICQVNPGWVLTDSEKERKVQDGLKEDWFHDVDPSRAPFGRLFQPEEVAEFVLYLFSPTCRVLSGSILDFVQMPVGP